MRTLHLAVGFAIAFSLGESPELSAATASDAPAYASYVCWDYPQLPPLRAWKETEQIMAAALAESYPRLDTLAREQNGSPIQVRDFLAKLPRDGDRPTLVYLAAHQSPGGQWYFPDKSVASWGNLAHGLPAPRSAPRLVMLDCCYAQADAFWTDWTTNVGPACLFASTADQPTPDLFVYRRRPVDWAVELPRVVPWLRQHHIDNLDTRMSYFGLIWLETWLEQAQPPHTPEEWNRFAQSVAELGRRTAAQVRTGYSSQITFVPAVP